MTDAEIDALLDGLECGTITRGEATVAIRQLQAERDALREHRAAAQAALDVKADLRAERDRLAAQVALLREALKPLAENIEGNGVPSFVRNAREALAATDPQGQEVYLRLTIPATERGK
jgi:hypothetical protein